MLTWLIATVSAASLVTPVAVEAVVVTSPAAATQVLRLRAGPRSLRLELRRNDELFAPSYREVRWGPEGMLEHPESAWASAEPCFYQGEVLEHGVVIGRAAVRTCGREGLTVDGWLRFDGADWAVGRGGLQRLADAPDLGQLPPPGRRRWVEILAVNEEGYTASEGGAPEEHTASILNVVHGHYLAAGFQDTLLLTLAGQQTFTSNDPFDPTPVGSGEVDANSLLDQLDAWVAAADLPPHDHRQLFTTFDFEGPVAGRAILGGMCDLSIASSVIEAGGEPAAVATTAAHELGHSFGLVHDDTQNSCAATGFFMAVVTCVNCPQPTEFSPCSVVEMDAFLASPESACLDLRPHLGPGTCGDGVLDGSEACDCGPFGCAGVDPCCDETTCQLMEGATCSALEPCCTDACEIADEAQVCRAGGGGCDLEETCDGALAGCPADVLEPSGTSCADDLGVPGGCFAGSCSSYAGSCERLDEVFTLDLGFGLLCENQLASDPCGDLSCALSTGGCTTLTNFDGARYQVADGTFCGVGEQCLMGSCLPSADLDASLDDGCPLDSTKTTPGQCGCGATDLDRDEDGSADCLESCPLDPDKLEPGRCGCGEADPADSALPCPADVDTNSSDGDKGEACACSGAGGPLGAGWLALVLLVGRIRARR